MFFRPLITATSVCLMVATGLSAQSVNFGNDQSDYANDGECDDRRFVGMGMAQDLDEDDNLHDATDCRRLFEGGAIKLVSKPAGQKATQCNVLSFGDNSSEWANDGECDDPRFDGPASAGVIAAEDLLRDATDCKAACDSGRIWLRVAGD